MIAVEGKHYYTFEEAATETGYTISTIKTYVKKNQVEGHKLPDGWVLTETGMKQLRIRSSRESKTPPHEEEIIAVTRKIEPEPAKEENIDHIVDVNKMIDIESPVTSSPKPANIEPNRQHGPTGKSIHFTTPEMKAVYDKLTVYALAKGKSVKEVCVELLKTALVEKEETLAKIEQLEQQKRALLEQL